MVIEAIEEFVKDEVEVQNIPTELNEDEEVCHTHPDPKAGNQLSPGRTLQLHQTGRFHITLAANASRIHALHYLDDQYFKLSLIFSVNRIVQSKPDCAFYLITILNLYRQETFLHPSH